MARPSEGPRSQAAAAAGRPAARPCRRHGSRKGAWCPGIGPYVLSPWGGSAVAAALGALQQLIARQHHQPRRFDTHGPLALEALELLIDTLARCAQQLRQVLLCQLQAYADFLALRDAVA